MKPARILGHHVHPMLIVFPLGLLAISVLFDAFDLARHDMTFAAIAYWNVVAGVIGGLVAAVFGLWDWLGVPRGTRARAIGAWHGVVNVCVVALFAITAFVRHGDPAHQATRATLALSWIALALALVGGWLGGELVERLGIGVDRGAEPNAPNSIAMPESRWHAGGMQGRPTR
ncbi:MAG TPA: DUF2231 domain-containing protein [Candidatus Eisenbacteria bacterium]|nr:DUF2231 domain-containing protein [Candidatus Eisenbacteria bacterium]